MLVCFGAAWPFSVYKSYKTKTTKGKSFGFLLTILIGYLSGIVYKSFYNFDYVILLYVVNSALVSTDILLFYRNKKLDIQ